MSELKMRLEKRALLVSDWSDESPTQDDIIHEQRETIYDFVREVNRKAEAKGRTSALSFQPSAWAIQETLKELGIEL